MPRPCRPGSGLARTDLALRELSWPSNCELSIHLLSLRIAAQCCVSNLQRYAAPRNQRPVNTIAYQLNFREPPLPHPALIRPSFSFPIPPANVSLLKNSTSYCGASRHLLILWPHWSLERIYFNMRSGCKFGCSVWFHLQPLCWLQPAVYACKQQPNLWNIKLLNWSNHLNNLNVLS